MRQEFALLGLAPGASVVEVKRAYAKRLKVTRPDEDAVAFQHLQHAYEVCLAYAKHHAAEGAPAVPFHPLADALDAAPAIEREVEEEEPALADGEPEPARRSRIARMGEPAAPPPPRVPPPPSRRRSPMPSRAAKLRPEAAGLDAAQLQALLAEIVAQGETLSTDRLAAWLAQHESLMSLDVQRLVASHLPAYLVANPPRFDSNALRVIYHFFLGAEYTPAVLADAELQRAWEMVRGEEEWRRAVSQLRRRETGTLDRLALQELLKPPVGWRRVFLQAMPGSSGKVTGLLRELMAFDEMRARRDIDPATLEFWLARMDRLSWASMAGLLAAFATMVGAIVGFICWSTDLGVAAWLGITATMTALGAAAYGFSLLVAWLRRLREERVARLLAAGRKPWDMLLSTVGSLGVLAFLMALSHAKFDTGLAGFAIPLAAVAGVPLVFAGGRRRIEAVFCFGAGAFFGFDVVASTPSLAKDPDAVLAMALALGTLACVLADVLHAMFEKITVAEARKDLNYVAVVFIVLAIGGWWGSALEEPPARAPMERVQPARHQPLIKPEVLEAMQRQAAQESQGHADSREAWDAYTKQQAQAVEEPAAPTWDARGSLPPKQVRCPEVTLLADEMQMLVATRIDRVRVRVRFDENGRTVDTKVVKSTGNKIIDSIAEGTAYNCEVVPAKRLGVYVGGEFVEAIKLR